ncbi:MAG: PEP-CTERM sorting domain-containing protein [Sphingomonadales bacterium]|nr:PEP-CTERM sorting domain-containing protein [Sphingomonadales bacterium]
MYNKRIAPLASALAGALLLFSTNASATVLPFDLCLGNSCDWSDLIFDADPTTGDVWVKFETAIGAGDKGHIEGNPGDIWQVTVGNSPVTAPDIREVFGDPFLTDMDQPITSTDVLITADQTPGFLNFTVEFLNAVFVHDIHFPCAVPSFSPTDCVDFFANARAGLTIDSSTDIITGLWEVPEPGPLPLLGLGLLGLGVIRRRGA